MAIARASKQQLAWQDLEVGLFVHMDMFIYRPGWHWRDNPAGGVPPAELFNPHCLNTDQWVEAAKAAGARYMVLTAKHATGFCLWPTDIYPYGVKQSPWRQGTGDIVGDFTASCRRAGIRAGIYCSFPTNWYLNIDDPGRPISGDPQEQSRYRRIYEAQVRELWSRYGDLCEIWFDGGVLPVEEGGPDVLPILQKHQPDAMAFQGPRPTIRWVGNEDGWAPDPCWHTVADLEPIRRGNHVGAGDADGQFWCPAEVDTTLIWQQGDPLCGWFWRPGCDETIYSLDHLMTLYYHSVGRGCNLILNSTPGPDGLIPGAHMRRYAEFGNEIRRRFAVPVATMESGDMELRLTRPSLVDHVVTMESIADGQRIRRYVIEGVLAHSHGTWRELVCGTSIGHKRIDCFPPVELDAVRLRVLDAAGPAQLRSLSAYCVAGTATE